MDAGLKGLCICMTAQIQQPVSMAPEAMSS